MTDIVIKNHFSFDFIRREEVIYIIFRRNGVIKWHISKQQSVSKLYDRFVVVTVFHWNRGRRWREEEMRERAFRPQKSLQLRKNNNKSHA